MTRSPDEYAAEVAARDATDQYRWITDTSESDSGDNIMFADESEWMDNYENED